MGRLAARRLNPEPPPPRGGESSRGADVWGLGDFGG